MAYSLYLKHLLFVDVMAVAAGFVLRAYAGLVAIDVDISEWLLLCTGLLALFLGFGKRRGEAVALGGQAHPQRPVLEEYSVDLIDELIAVVTPSIIVAYSLYAVLGSALAGDAPDGAVRDVRGVPGALPDPSSRARARGPDHGRLVGPAAAGLHPALGSQRRHDQRPQLVPRALVTGGTGFLGGHLATALEGAGFEVRLLDVNPPERGSREFVHADVSDAGAIRAAAEGCEVVVDNAALVPVTRASAAEYRSVNVGGCRNTLDAAGAAGAYVLHISSSAIFGVPSQLPVTDDAPLAAFEPYGRSKAEAEGVVHERRGAGLVVGSLRPRTLVGEGRLGLFDIIFARIRSGRRVPLFGRGQNRVQMCDVEDFCAAALAAIERRSNDDHNIGSAGFGTVREDLQGLIERVGSRSRLQPVPVWAIRAVLQPLDVVGRSPFNEWHWRSAPAPFYFDISRACAELGWEPRRTNLDALEHAYRHYERRTGTTTGSSAHRRPLRGALARLLRG